jgi:hypothetical protein
LLIPYAFWELGELLKIANGKITRNALMVFSLTLLLCNAAFVTVIRSTRFHPPQELVASINWIKNNANPGDTIVLDDYFHPYIVLRSSLNISQFITPDFDTGTKMLAKNLLEIFRAKKPSFLLYSFNEGAFRKVFHFSAFRGTEERFGLHFKAVCGEESYRVYRIIYPNN